MGHKELKAIAAKYALAVFGNAAYGYLGNCRVSLTDHPKYLTLSIYVGALDAAPEGKTPRTMVNAQTIADIIRKGNGDTNAYALTGDDAVAIGLNGSVVHIKLMKTAAEAIDLLIANLPSIAPLTAPLQCIHCGGHTGGQGVPVRMSDDVIVPMHDQCLTQCLNLHRASAHPAMDLAAEKKGWLGCAIGAAIAAFAWILGYQADWIGWLLAVTTVAMVFGGFRLMKGSGDRMLLPVSVCSAAAILLGAVSHTVIELHGKYVSFGSIVHGMMRESVYIRVELLSGSLLWQMMICIALAGFCVIGLYAFLNRGKEQAMIKPQKMQGQA